MDLENYNFLDFVKAAGQSELEYLLIGGLALALHGIPRYTQDADVWVRPTDQNKARLLNTLFSLGYDSEAIADIERLDFAEAQVVRLEGPIDILTRVYFNVVYDQCRERAREFTTVTGNRIYFVDINDLGQLKILARRPKDLHDVAMIDEILEEMSRKNKE